MKKNIITILLTILLLGCAVQKVDYDTNPEIIFLYKVTYVDDSYKHGPNVIYRVYTKHIKTNETRIFTIPKKKYLIGDTIDIRKLNIKQI